MSSPKLKILISGAGIAGPCLAYWLSKTRLEIDITILERSATPRVTGQAIDIRGPAIQIIRRMGLEDAVRAQHTTETGTVFLNSRGDTFAEFGSSESNTSFTAEYEILRADLSKLFLEATEGLRNVRYIYGDSIECLGQTEKDVNVTFTSGSTAVFDLIVAADGSTSKTRSMILDERTLKGCYNFFGQYIAFFSIPRTEADPLLWKWYNAPKGRCLMLRPHRNPKTMGAYLCITMPAREQRNPEVEVAMEKGTAETKRMLHSYFADAGWEAKRILEGLDQADDFYMSGIAQVKLPKWTNNRALVLGDAAYATMGVGTSLAIEGAYFLAGELSKIKSNEEVPEAVERYEEVFRPYYAKVGDVPKLFPQLAMPQTAWGLWMRDFIIWFMCKSQIFKLLQRWFDESVDTGTLPDYDWVGV